MHKTWLRTALAAGLLIAASGSAVAVGDDCNGNGIDDALDLAARLDFGVARSVLTGYAARAHASGDLNGDGVEDILCVGSSGWLAVSLSKADGTYDLPDEYTVGSSTYGVAAGDLDGDNDLDVVTANRADKSLSLLRNNGSGSLLQYGSIINIIDDATMAGVITFDLENDNDTDIAVLYDDRIRIHVNTDGTGNGWTFGYGCTFGSYCTDIKAARLNDDVYEDLVVVDRDDGHFYVLLNNGNGTFATPVGVWNGGRPMSAVTADLDDDGDIDIALTEQGIVNRVRIFLNDGDANFTAGVFPTVGEDPEAIAAADLDGDDDLDLAITLNAEATLTILLNDGSAAFTDGGSYPIGSYPVGLTATDFDLDDDVDLVASTFGATLNLLENDGSGVFPGPPVKVSSGLSRANALGAVDLDHDDDLDLVVGSYGGSQVVVLLNDGGTLTAQPPITTGASPSQIAWADFNDDTHMDLAVANTADGNVALLFNNGDATFGAPVAFPIGTEAIGVAAADFDGDEDMDFAATYPGEYSGGAYGQGVLWIFFNNGSGQFPDTALYPTGNGAGLITVNDFNGDEAPDVALTNRDSNDVSVFINNGDGSMQPAVSYAFGTWLWGITSADLDGDDDVDLAVIYIATSQMVEATVGIFRNNGDGTFATVEPHVVNGGAAWIAAADVDDDGDQDLAISQTFGDEVSILQNQGNATFVPNSAWLVSDGPMGLAIVDLDGDETREIVVAAMNNGDISIAYGDHAPPVSRDCNDNGVPDECDWGYYAGDVNCDGSLNLFDIDPFVTAMADPVGYQAAYPDCELMLADLDCNGEVNLFDIDPFVDLLIRD